MERVRLISVYVIFDTTIPHDRLANYLSAGIAMLMGLKLNLYYKWFFSLFAYCQMLHTYLIFMYT